MAKTSQHAAAPRQQSLFAIFDNQRLILLPRSNAVMLSDKSGLGFLFKFTSHRRTIKETVQMIFSKLYGYLAFCRLEKLNLTQPSI